MWGLILVAGAIFFLLVAPALSIAAYRATRRLESELAHLRREIRTLRDRQEAEAYRAASPVASGGTSGRAGAIFVAAISTEAAPPEAPFVSSPVPEPDAPFIHQPQAPQMSPAQTADPSPRGLELRLGARGFVWLGGACIALASFFLVKYSIDEGLLGPGLRVVLGIVLGIALLVGGDFMRRKSATIGQALTAAGVAALYASLYAAVALYHLIPPAFAFVILAVLTFIAIGLALRHGPFVGLVGLAGGFVTPAVVSTGEPHPAILFSYLYLMQLGALWLERQRGWWYLPAIANAGGLCWAFLVVSLGMPNAGGIDAVALPIYLIVVAASVFWLSPRLQAATDWPELRVVGLASAAAAALLMLLWLGNGGFQPGDWAFVALLAIVGAVSGRLRPQHEIAGFALAAVPALGLLAWNADLFHPFDVDRYLWIAGMIGALGTGGGYALLWGARNPERWSLLSAVYGAAVLAIAYWRLRDIDLLLPWSIICLILSAVHLVFAERLRNWRFKDRFYRRAFGVHALACAGFLAAAVPLWVEREWLPVLWALMLPLIAWVANKIEEPWLRRGLWVAAPAVLVAVLVSGFPAGDRPIFNWLAYGLGVPTLCFAATAWLVRRASDLRLYADAAGRGADPGIPAGHAGDPPPVPWRGVQDRAVRICGGGHADAAVGRAGAGDLADGAAARRGAPALAGVWPRGAGGAAHPRCGVGPRQSAAESDPGLRPAHPQHRALCVRQRLRAVHGNGAHRAPLALDLAQRNATTAVAAAIALVDGFIGVSALNRHLFQGAFIDFGFGRPGLERRGVLRLFGGLADLWRADPRARDLAAAAGAAPCRGRHRVAGGAARSSSAMPAD